MREILFRGKHITTYERVDGLWEETTFERWIYGYLCDEMHIYSKELGGDMLINEKTLGQYTNLKDKNGKKIFEGDIVKCFDFNVNEGFIGIIEFGNPNSLGTWGWQIVPIQKTDFNIEILYWVDVEETGATIEVIGNVHDSLELLEVCNE